CHDGLRADADLPLYPRRTVEDPPLDTDDALDDVAGPVDVPLVEAVVVTYEPGPTLGDTLASLAAQHYPALSVVVVDTGSRDADAVEAQVRQALPGARFERRKDRNLAAAANRVVEQGAGAAFVLVVHDDVRLAPDTVRLLVEEAFRSNAGV